VGRLTSVAAVEGGGDLEPVKRQTFTLGVVQENVLTSSAPTTAVDGTTSPSRCG
jgi:hypothetical protein